MRHETTVMSLRVKGLKVCGMESCPLIHLRLLQTTGSQEQDQQLVESIVAECLSNGLAVVSAKYLEHEEHNQPPPRSASWLLVSFYCYSNHFVGTYNHVNGVSVKGSVVVISDLNLASFMKKRQF